MEKIDKLTPEQEKKLVEFRDEWLKIGLACGPADLSKVAPVMDMFYGKAKKATPYYWSCKSPLMANIIINVMDNMDKQGDDNLSEQDLIDYLQGGCNNPISEWVATSIDKKSTKLSPELFDEIALNFRTNLAKILKVDLKITNIDHARTLLDYGLSLVVKAEYINTWFWGSLDAYWIAHYLFPHLYIRPMHTPEQMELLNGWAELAKNSFWMYPYENICHVCDRPQEINKDEQTRLHNDHGPAVGFTDTWRVWYVHGVRVNEKIVMYPETITVQDIDGESNVEVRRIMIDQMGAAKYLMESDTKPVHQDNFGILYKRQVPGDEEIAIVKVINSTPEPLPPEQQVKNEYAPSEWFELDEDDFQTLYQAKYGKPYVPTAYSETKLIYKEYYLRVPPTIKRAKEAVAWTFGLKEDEYNPTQET